MSTIINSLGGNWSNTTIWNGGVPDSATATATIAATGTYTVTIANETETIATGSLDAIGATLNIIAGGTLHLAGAQAAFDLIAGTLIVAGGTIAGGTIDATGGTLELKNAGLIIGSTLEPGGTSVLNGGTLDDVTVIGTLAPFLANTVETLNILGGLTVTGGTIALTGNGFDTLDIEDNETLDHLAIVMGAGTNYFDGAYAYPQDYLDAGTENGGRTLTLGGHAVITEIAASNVGLEGGTIVNDGTILANGSVFDISSDEFINAGSILDAGVMTISSPAFANSGIITLGTGAALLDTGAGFANAGTISVAAGGTISISATAVASLGAISLGSNGTLDLGVSASLAALSGVSNGGGTLVIGQTLDLGSGQATIGQTGLFSDVVVTGALADGTIDVAGGTLVLAYGATLDAITYGGTPLEFTGLLNIAGGFTAPGGIIDVTGNDDTLAIDDSETLDHLTIELGAGTGYGGITDYLDSGYYYGGTTLTLGAHATIAEIAQSSVELEGGGAIVNDGTILATGSVFDIASALFVNAGSIADDGMMTVSSTSFVNSGIVEIGGSLDVGVALGGGGSLLIDAGATLEFAAANSDTVVFNGAAGDLRLDDPQAFSATLAALAAGDTIELPGAVLQSATIAGDTLEIVAPGTTYDFALAMPSFDRVTVSGDAAIVTAGIACYVAGTMIRTAGGEQPIETLAIGDLVVTHAGQTRPIRWIGRRSYSGRFAAANPAVLPVLFRAGALADCVPKRDLMVSPLHAMYLDEVLIPAAALVNGVSIVHVEAVEQVEYVHLELESHDVIIAENAPSETFIDDDSRGMFHNAADYLARYPGTVRQTAQYCAPRIEDGDALEAVRRRLASRLAPAGGAGTAPVAGRGYLDDVSRHRIRGWAVDGMVPGRPARLRVLDNGMAIGEVVADLPRADLAAAGIGQGRHAFTFHVPGGLSPDCDHVIQVQFASNGQDLKGSPRDLRAEQGTTGDTPAASRFGSRRGCVDHVTRDFIAGWAYDGAAAATPVAVRIIDNGVTIARLLANTHRPDLEAADIGRGRHAFRFDIPGGVSPLVRHVIEVRYESDGGHLANSPQVIEPAGSFDATMERAFAGAIAALGPDDARDRVLSFLLTQAERVRQQIADQDGQRAARHLFAQSQRRRGKPGTGDAMHIEPAPRALVIDAATPSAGRDAGSQALLSHMAALQRLGYAVSFAAADEMAQPVGAPALDRLGIKRCCAPFYSSVEDLLRRQAGCFDLVYLHRAEIAARYQSLARRYAPGARIVFSVADLHHVRLARQAAIEDRPELLAYSQRMQVAEQMAAWSADAVITHSALEADLLRRAVPAARVHVVPWDVARRAMVARGHGVAFIGGYRHAPNVDAAQWLVEIIMPLVWQVDPAIECLLVGSDMPNSVRRLARPGIRVLGHVADLGGDVFDRVRLTVAPLRFGAGLKGKVLDSLAAGVPCVMSEVAAEGFAFGPVLAGLVGRDAAAIARLICMLHHEDEAYRAAAEAGAALVEQGFTEDVVAEALKKVTK